MSEGKAATIMIVPLTLAEYSRALYQAADAKLTAEGVGTTPFCGYTIMQPDEGERADVSVYVHLRLHPTDDR